MVYVKPNFGQHFCWGENGYFDPFSKLFWSMMPLFYNLFFLLLFFFKSPMFKGGKYQLTLKTQFVETIGI